MRGLGGWRWRWRDGGGRAGLYELGPPLFCAFWGGGGELLVVRGRDVFGGESLSFGRRSVAWRD